MKVKVVPKRPISGILPKNKWIDSELELDLNRIEISRCMQFGTVYDMDGIVIDDKYVSRLNDMGKLIPNVSVKIIDSAVIEKNEPAFVPFVSIKGPIEEVKEPESTTTVYESDEPIVIDMGGKFPEEPVTINETVEKEEIISELELLSCKKEDDYIILEVQFNSTNKLEKSMYGLFNITAGSRPSVEYKKGENWIKFSNKFNNFSLLEDGYRFVFRFVPKNESELKYKLLIKSGNDIIAVLEEKINPAQL